MFQLPAPAVVWEFCILLGVSLFLLCFGLSPLTGGDRLGLVGADEPRYAQIAREMLASHEEACAAAHTSMWPGSLRPADIEAAYHCILGGTVTPVLYGQPWLEKPALYYWRAMGFFKEFGVSDWSARLPSTSGAFALIFLIYLHMKRFRPGGQLDAALITASSLAIIAFARGASTDMQLAAPFCIGMLGWYAWYETGKKFWLFDLYFFGAAATLAKGPVAPFLALAIISLFLGLRREWSALRRTIWVPGIILYLVMVLPWYIAVQKRNPTFYRSFFLEHNLERFATNRYQHHQPFWYYLAVLILGLMPWTVVSIRALFSALQVCLAEWRVRKDPKRYLGHSRAGDAFPEFLVLWALFPILFFSFSGSKLPGYILPSIPPITILTGDYLNRIRRRGLTNSLLWSHAIVCAVLVFVLVLAPQHMKYETLVPSALWLVCAGVAAVTMGAVVLFMTRRWGTTQMTNATLIPVVATLIFLLGFYGKELDLNYSARPLANEIARQAPGVEVVALQNVKRDMDYGLAFYRNRPTVHYPVDGVPQGEHLLVLRANDTETLDRYLAGRIYKPLFLYESQGLEIYRVYANDATASALPASTAELAAGPIR
ncbi:Polymyxin resistance protein ArnT [Granulicella sibirica]|uniref:Polymyxin resistance protein ArnT n=1 Tax=Granulicella sibirica TaxID=2479048 RepID=A0A4Q0T6G2_9BACT|nr:glycosyltransferase family 39 protein [Granulicella sibirica]RXH57599.1 Polymyxin resistance protein ArnT [Granulicella sibirica]